MMQLSPSPPDQSIGNMTMDSLSDFTNSPNHDIHSPRLQFTELVGHQDEFDSSISSSSSSSTSSTVSAGEELQSPLDDVEKLLCGFNLDSDIENRPKPSYQRIIEYENALISSGRTRKHSEGPVFQVTKKEKMGSEGPQLEDFPNEVLTQIFSHLPASSLSSAELVSRRFNHLVADPHVSRVAFSRFFPGQDVTEATEATTPRVSEDEQIRDQRFFTRLTGLATWRSEYGNRTRLLRSLVRAKPGSSCRNNSGMVSAVMTYTSELPETINHIHGVFGPGEQYPRFIHGTDETGSAGSSDPANGKVDAWGIGEHAAMFHFADFDEDELYGLGSGPTGLPNVMDVSQPFGLVCGEGIPGGMAFYRAASRLRGAFLSHSTSEIADAELGIPDIPITEAISAVWIAKSLSVPNITNGVVGILTGSTVGLLSAYALGLDHHPKAPIGAPMARWVLCPGVPIVAISVDDSYSDSRKASGRAWVVVLNALGEVFYLTDVPTHPTHLPLPPVPGNLDTQAWITGQSVYWQVLEASRRVARDDPWHKAEVHGSYSPRPSCVSMNLSKEQVAEETREIEKFLNHLPSHFRAACYGWDMRRRLEVDFSGDDGKGAGENVFVINCGIHPGGNAEIKRYTRYKVQKASLDVTLPRNKEWGTSLLSLKSHPGVEITTSAIDLSTYALLTIDEDPLYTVDGGKGFTTSSATPSETFSTRIPGYRARHLAVGTKLGQIILWNMRGPRPANPQVVNELHPIRTIDTDSPQISCLAISALFLVHGGSDGLVQAWDPLASSTQPIRTLHSRFSSRARRRLIQADARIHGVASNHYAAGAIVLDPDPTILRGMVSLGTHLRYWHYSSSAADELQIKKRRLRRGPRGLTVEGSRYCTTRRRGLNSDLKSIQQAMDHRRTIKAKNQARFARRFGIGFRGLSEEDSLRYAKELSAQTLIEDEERRIEEARKLGTNDNTSSSIITPEAIEPNCDYDHEEAVRLSLNDGHAIGHDGHSHSNEEDYDFDLTYKPRNTLKSEVSKSMYKDNELADDLEFALQLSLAEERSKQEAKAEFFLERFEGNGEGPSRATSSSSSISQAYDHTFESEASNYMYEYNESADDLEFALQLSLSEERSKQTEAEDFPSLGHVGKGKGRAL